MRMDAGPELDATRQMLGQDDSPPNAARLVPTGRGQEQRMLEILLIVLIVLLLFGGGGYYWRGRRI